METNTVVPEVLKALEVIEGQVTAKQLAVLVGMVKKYLDPLLAAELRRQQRLCS